MYISILAFIFLAMKALLYEINILPIIISTITTLVTVWASLLIARPKQKTDDFSAIADASTKLVAALQIERETLKKETQDLREEIEKLKEENKLLRNQVSKLIDENQLLHIEIDKIKERMQK